MSAKLINITLDLETLSTQHDAAIIQIGCCIPQFDHVYIPKGISHEFEVTIKYEDALQSEFHKSHSTMDWWAAQPSSTRMQVFSGQNSYTDAFDQFKWWIESLKTDGSGVAIWGNGSDFDNRLLSYSLDSLGYHNVWSFRNNRDLRTLKALFPFSVTEDRINEIKHTALGDARYEARLLNDTARFYNLENL
jgi:3' exoribonuclease, RNase T-like